MVLVFLCWLMILRRVKISAIILAWVLFLVHSFVPHHHVEELLSMASAECVAETHGHYHTHAGTNGDGLPYLNHSEEFGSRLIKTDPIILKLDKQIPTPDVYLPAVVLHIFTEAHSFVGLPRTFVGATNQSAEIRLSSPPLPGRAPPAFS